MSTRYSGTLILTIRYVDATESYTVRIREANDAARFETLTKIRLAPIHNNLAADSPKAYDLVAEAALGFASYADEAIHQFACPADDDSRAQWHIGRRQSQALSAKWGGSV